MFQFTHPVWGATLIISFQGHPQIGFNSRTPCGVRPCAGVVSVANSIVSIHAPRVGCDSHRAATAPSEACFNSRTPCGVRLSARPGCSVIRLFQFTHPVWGATQQPLPTRAGLRVSIHAPRVGCDVGGSLRLDIYRAFQFTHPVWGATPPPARA